MGSNETRNLWLSIAAGLFSTFLLYSYSQEKKAEYDKKFGSTKRIIVAKEDIAEMQTIYDNMIDIVDRPNDFAEPDVLSTPEEVVGNVAAIPIKKGQQVVKNKLLAPGPDTGISNQIALSKRAITIPIDEVRGIAKLIRPGDRVDIFAALDTGKGLNQRREASLLMQDVVILATGVSIVNNIPRVFELDSSGKNLNQISLTGDTKYSTITIEASPKEAQDLVYILSTAPGNLYFVLRNPHDRAIPPRLPSSTAETVTGKPVFDLGNATVPSLPPAAPPSAPAPAQLPARGTAPGAKPNNNSFRTL